MEATHIPLWTFGPVKCVKVPLYEVESSKEAILLYEEKPPDTCAARTPPHVPLPVLAPLRQSLFGALSHPTRRPAYSFLRLG